MTGFAKRKTTRVAGTWLCLLWSATAAAHEGPPYPIVVDEPLRGYAVSVWGDPDVGTGTFYVILEPIDSSESAAPPRVEVWVQPVSGRLKRVSYPARREDVKDRIQFFVETKFDRQERWLVGIVVHHLTGPPSELTTEVEVTPPGYGPWDLVIYLVPFLLFGGLWVIALLRRWRAASRQPVRATDRLTQGDKVDSA